VPRTPTDGRRAAAQARARSRARGVIDLHTAGHRRGVVAAPDRAAVAARRGALAEGGNALEAIVAMAAAIVAVYPHMNHVGGDGFWLVREPSGRAGSPLAGGAAGG